MSDGKTSIVSERQLSTDEGFLPPYVSVSISSGLADKLLEDFDFVHEAKKVKGNKKYKWLRDLMAGQYKGPSPDKSGLKAVSIDLPWPETPEAIEKLSDEDVTLLLSHLGASTENDASDSRILLGWLHFPETALPKNADDVDQLSDFHRMYLMESFGVTPSELENAEEALAADVAALKEHLFPEE